MGNVETLTYLLCPKCQRKLPVASKERYCPNDGSRMLRACPQCNASITSPYSSYCTKCGKKLLEDVPASVTTKLNTQDVQAPTKDRRKR